MCFSKDASLTAFIMGMGGSLLTTTLDKPTDKIVGYFFMFTALIQLIEYFLWNHQICDDYNRTISILGMLFVHLQPIILGLLMILINPELSSINLNSIILIIIVYLVIMIIYSKQFLDNKEIQCTMQDESGHLLWKWEYMNYNTIAYPSYLVATILLCMYGTPVKEHGIYYASIILFTFLSSVYIYSGHIGSIWCFYSVSLPLIYYLLRINDFIQY